MLVTDGGISLNNALADGDSFMGNRAHSRVK